MRGLRDVLGEQTAIQVEFLRGAIADRLPPAVRVLPPAVRVLPPTVRTLSPSAMTCHGLSALRAMPRGREALEPAAR